MEAINYAFTYSAFDSYRGWRSSLAREYVHTDGRIDQIDFERSGGYRRGRVALERVWTTRFPPERPNWSWMILQISGAMQAIEALKPMSWKNATAKIARQRGTLWIGSSNAAFFSTRLFYSPSLYRQRLVFSLVWQLGETPGTLTRPGWPV